MGTDEPADVIATSADGRYRVRVVWDEETGDWSKGELLKALGEPDDVWGYVVERREVWVNRAHTMDPQRVPYSEIETWEHHDSLFGISGHAEAESLGREALAEAGGES